MPDHYRGSARKAAYAEYLKSEHWKILKLSKILQEDKVCAACSSMEYIQLHHMLYRATFEETELEDTCWLCRGCHKTFHLRAGVKIKTKLTGLQLREETIRIILAERKPSAKGRMSKKERRRLRVEIRRKKRAERRAKHEANAERNRALGKPTKASLGIKQQTNTARMNELTSKISPRSPLKSSMAGMVVVVAKA